MELIEVKLKENVSCRMTSRALRFFLEHDLVDSFKRSDGWVSIGRDRVRKSGHKIRYRGQERRDYSESFRVCINEQPEASQAPP